MKIRNFYYVLCFLLILLCKPKPVIYSEAEEHKYKHDKFHFDGSKLPIPGETTESNLREMYPEGPSTILTFKRRINKKLFGKSFPVSRIFEYLNTTFDKQEDGNLKSYVRKEMLVLVVFLDKGVVQDYIIDHSVRSENGDNVIGRFHHMPPGSLEIEMWPGSQKDSECYWLQRPDRDKFVNSSEFTCDRWADSKPSQN
ncbi:MAG: hypothetical protein O9264_12620 [Leptospira sp.]|nr:hypothetical protein [Leptospira sp.]